MFVVVNECRTVVSTLVSTCVPALLLIQVLVVKYDGAGRYNN